MILTTILLGAVVLVIFAASLLTPEAGEDAPSEVLPPKPEPPLPKPSTRISASPLYNLGNRMGVLHFFTEPGDVCAVCQSATIRGTLYCQPTAEFNKTRGELL